MYKIYAVYYGIGSKAKGFLSQIFCFTLQSAKKWIKKNGLHDVEYVIMQDGKITHIREAYCFAIKKVN